MQLQNISGVAKGLTRTSDSLLVLDQSFEGQAEAEQMQHSRNDLRMVKLREDLFSAIGGTVNLWSTDAGVSDVSVVTLYLITFFYV